MTTIIMDKRKKLKKKILFTIWTKLLGFIFSKYFWTGLVIFFILSFKLYFH